MKKWIVLLALIFSYVSYSQQPKESKLIYKFDLKDNINPSIFRKLKLACQEAKRKKADFFLIEMNTFGGYLISADSIRTLLLNLNIPTYVYINNNAASAGALIAIACDRIYMHPSASIGAATVVDQKGEKMADKYQSYMRSIMRATAESHGGDTLKNNEIKWHRDPKIAEAMVDESIEIPGIIEKGKILTFTANEAKKNHFCEGIKNNLQEVIKSFAKDDYTVQTYKPSSLDNIIGFMMNPVLQGILIMIIIGGIYFELQTPGVGFPIVAALVAAILYFSPLYLEGLATHWEVAMFILGVLLVLLEIFVIPGFGVAGVTGIILMIVGLSLSMIDVIDFEFEGIQRVIGKVSKPFFIVFVFTGLGLIFSIILTKKISTLKFFGRIALRKEAKVEEGFIGVEKKILVDLIGKNGLAISDLRPSGTVEIGKEYYDAVSIYGFISKGKKVKVIRHEASQIYVEELV